MFSAMAALHFDLPAALKAAGLRAHAFVNAGNVAQLWGPGGAGGLGAGLRELGRGVRCAVGVGLVYPIQAGMLEANVCR